MHPPSLQSPIAPLLRASRPDPGNRRWSLVAWLVILVLVGVVAVLQSGKVSTEPKAPPPTAGQADQANLVSIPPPMKLLEVSAKAVIGDADPNQRVAVAGTLTMLGQTPADRLRIHMLESYAAAQLEKSATSPTPAAGTSNTLTPRQLVANKLEALAGELDKEPPPPFTPERQARRKILAADARLAASLTGQNAEQARLALVSLSESDRNGLIERHTLFGRVLVFDALPRAEQDEILTAAKSTYTALLTANLAVLAIVALAFGLGITAVILLMLGKVRSHIATPAPGGSVMLETFALFLVAFMLVSLLGLFVPSWVTGILRWCLLGVALWPLCRGMTWPDLRTALGWTSGPTGRWYLEAFYGVVGYLAMLPLVVGGVIVTLILIAISNLMGGAPPPVHPIGEELATGNIWQIINLTLMATVWAPVVEETMFRGALYRHLRGIFRGPGLWIIAGLIQGLIFAAIHPQGLLGIPSLMMAGFLFSALREWRGSLIAAMTGHALNNGMIVIMILLIT